jgi:hypothetical protein
VQLTHSARIGIGDLNEGAAAQDKVDSPTLLDSRGPETSMRHLDLEDVDCVVRTRQLGCTPVPILASDLPGVLLATHRIGQQGCQPGICAGGSPTTRSVRVKAIQQPGTTGTVAVFEFFHDQVRCPENGEMLADGVVVQLHVLGQLSYPDRAWSICDIAE